VAHGNTGPSDGPVTIGLYAGADRSRLYREGQAVGIEREALKRDEWIEDLETLGQKMDQYIEERRQVTGFDLRYNDTIQPGEDAWRDCAAVLGRRDLENIMRQGW
jgi:hypothetical protein